MLEINLERILGRFESDQKLRSLAKAYTTRMRARRQLRAVFGWLNQIDQHLKQNRWSDLLEPLYMASLIRYASWFKMVKGKRILNESDIFGTNNKMLEAHNEFIKMRDKVFAHPEQELSGGDYFEVSYSKEGLAKEIFSHFNVQITADLEGLIKCVTTAHDTLDAEIIPKFESELLDYINTEEFLSVQE